MLRGLRLSSAATRHPRMLAVAHGRHASAIRLRCTVAAAPEKIEHDIGASVVDELERLEVPVDPEGNPWPLDEHGKPILKDEDNK